MTIASIESLAFISSAAESTDRDTRAYSKLTWNIRSAIIWAANGFITAVENDREIENSRDRLHTLLTVGKLFAESIWFEIDEPAVRLHLGLEDDSDVHEQAIKQARQKVLATRSAAKFKEFYDAARDRIEERNRERAARVVEIVDLCNSDVPDGEYNEDTIDREIESLEGKIAEVSEAIYHYADMRIAGAFVPATEEKYRSFKEGARMMLGVLGISEDGLLKRQAKLKDQLAQQEAAMRSTDAELEKQMAEQAATMIVQPAAPAQGGRRVIKSPERLAREQADTAARQEQIEYDKQLAVKAAKTKATKAMNKKAKDLTSPSLGDDPFWQKAGDLVAQ